MRVELAPIAMADDQDNEILERLRELERENTVLEMENNMLEYHVARVLEPAGGEDGGEDGKK